MSDSSLPLTISEYDEWGNPNDPQVIEYLKTYDPLRNVNPRSYPNLYVIGSLNDTRVPFSDALKWVNLIRTNSINKERLYLLQIDDGIGHTGDQSITGLIEQNAKIFSFLSKTIK